MSGFSTDPLLVSVFLFFIFYFKSRVWGRKFRSGLLHFKLMTILLVFSFESIHEIKINFTISQYCKSYF